MSGSILQGHISELRGLKKMKKDGVQEVPHILKFVKNAGIVDINDPHEFRMIPIDEAIKSWEEPIADMKAGANQEQYNY